MILLHKYRPRDIYSAPSKIMSSLCRQHGSDGGPSIGPDQALAVWHYMGAGLGWAGRARAMFVSCCLFSLIYLAIYSDNQF